ncbi:MAG: aminodeoxychorismate/anthranilate synthase component II, partial [Planctomycetota bacterium]|nr:aminodeoxychorismate/anthranilate synthase component II [Planctomycetota bacterium]
PREAGISCDIIRELGPKIPLLGVCLGHQAIGEALGGRVIRAPEPVHGRTSRIEHHGRNLFRDLPNPIRATRYHSLIVEAETLPDSLRIVATTADGIPMAIEHREWPVYGVQFHPESILTEGGHRLLANFLHLAGLVPGELPPGDRPPALDPDEARLVEMLRTRPIHW